MTGTNLLVVDAEPISTVLASASGGATVPHRASRVRHIARQHEAEGRWVVDFFISELFWLVIIVVLEVAKLCVNFVENK